MNAKLISATDLREGMVICYDNPRFNQHVAEVQFTRDGQVRVETDYGNGGEPAVDFYQPTVKLFVKQD